MRVFRARSSGFTSIALAWQLLAMIFAPTALCCRDDRDRATDAPAPVAAAECPMHHEDAAAPEPSCPLHTQAAPHECDCPTLGCSQTDKGFMALFGPIGVLSAPTTLSEPRTIDQAVIIAVPSTSGLAPAPALPPPRN